ncbi:hypothetical protein ABVT39_006123 [Epinephelus coioides]
MDGGALRVQLHTLRKLNQPVLHNDDYSGCFQVNGDVTNNREQTAKLKELTTEVNELRPQLQAVIDPADIDPADIDPSVIDPAVIDPADIDPAVIDPADIDPAVIDPADINPAVIDPADIDPATHGRKLSALSGEC